MAKGSRDKEELGDDKEKAPMAASGSDGSSMASQGHHPATPPKSPGRPVKKTKAPKSSRAAKKDKQTRSSHVQETDEEKASRRRFRRPKKPRGRHHKEWTSLPMITMPQGKNGEWLTHDQRAQQWLSLFYDLSVAAVLSVFSGTHNFQQPSKIPIFVSYFVIIQWVWVSQTYYDIRFQSEDVLHRVFKCAQILLFVYLGAVNQHWDLSQLRDPYSYDDLSDSDFITRLLAGQSFFTLVLAFLISRAVLAVQYIVMWWIAVKTGRKRRLFIVNVCTLALSAALNIVALAVPTDSNGRVAVVISMVYISILVELVSIILQTHSAIRFPFDVTHLAQRTGELTLIILGESGFSSLTKSFNLAVGGFSDTSKATYAQVFLSIGIIVMIYLFLYAWFDPREEVTESRALIWQAIHYPLHLGLLLLLSAVVNTVVVISYIHGLDTAADGFNVAISSVLDDSPVSGKQADKIFKYLDRLSLQPDFYTMIENLATWYNQTSPTVNAQVRMLQYFGQVLIKTTDLYGIQVEGQPTTLLTKLNAVSTDMPENVTLIESRNQEATRVFADLLWELVSDGLSGTLWLFPCAGFVLIVAALRSVLWYRLDGFSHNLIHGGMAVSGLVLACLGLLDIGKTRVTLDINESDFFKDPSKVAPMYDLVIAYVPLVIVLGVYALTYGVASYTLWFLKRRRGKRKEGV